MLTSGQSFQVLAISPGIAVGRVQPVHRKSSSGAPVLETISEAQVPSELARVRQAIDKTRQQLTALQSAVREKLESRDDAGIFDAHLLLVEDRSLLREVENIIKTRLWSAEYALYDTAEHFVRVFANIQDEFLKERAADIRDVANRLLNNLTSQENSSSDDRDDRRIIIAS
ncbi:MAG: hypothetical protein IKC05_02915, partial [Lentisphaeria bacterium]|nr:hypothetical protein [Lentisphaeria bacterium]